MTLTPTELLEQLTTAGGCIVPSNDCTAEDIALAQAEDRFAADDDGIGFVRLSSLPKKKPAGPKAEPDPDRPVNIPLEIDDHTRALIRTAEELSEPPTRAEIKAWGLKALSRALRTIDSEDA